MSTQGLTHLPVNWSWTTIALLLTALPFAFTYLFTSLRYFIQLRSKKHGREPPTLPYFIPGLGHALAFAQDSENFFKRIVSQHGYQQPVGVRLGPTKIFLLADPRQTEIMLRSSKELSTKPNIVLVVENFFGLPRSAAKHYDADDSGSMPKPLPGSTTKPEDRIFFHQHHTSFKYLTGDALNLMTERLVENFECQLMQGIDIGKEWVEMPDFWLFFRGLMFRASVEALFGKHIFTLNPSLTEDFWEFDRYGLSLLKGLPRWMNPKAYAARDRVIGAIKKWQKFARDHVDPTKLAADPEWEPYWGAKIFRARQQYMAKMHFMNDEAQACEDVGFLFASNANAIPAAAWMSLYAFLDPVLLARARKDVDDSFKSDVNTNGAQKLDIAKLCSKPLLQSMYAETLRLTGGIIVGRTPRDGPFKLGEWVYPKGVTIFSSARTAAMNPEVWNTGSPEKPHPLDSFWEDRFIIYPNDPKSGPLKERDTRYEKIKEPEFSLRNLQGVWFPYGGGSTMCPGRHFAKQEMIAGMAVLAAHFDIELQVPDGFIPQVDSSYFPLGVLPIKDKIPFRVKRRT